jgi:hypothetical protein
MNTLNKYTGRGLWLTVLLLISLIIGCNSAYTPTPVTSEELSTTVTTPADSAISDNSQVPERSNYANTEVKTRPLPPTNLTVK